MNSCIYNGTVSHVRFKPVKHHLKYKTFSLFIDLDEIEKLDKNNLIFSFNKFNIFSFYNRDHGDRDGKSLKDWIFQNLKKFNIKQNINGLVVTQLKGSSVFKKGDLIIEAEMNGINNIKQLKSQLNAVSINEKEYIIINFIRQNNKKLVAVKLK